MSRTIKQILREGLEATEYDGLVNGRLGCGCHVTDLCPCESPDLYHCVAGHNNPEEAERHGVNFWVEAPIEIPNKRGESYE